MVLNNRDVKNKAKLLASLGKEKARLDNQLDTLLLNETILSSSIAIHKESLHDINKYIHMLNMME